MKLTKLHLFFIVIIMVVGVLSASFVFAQTDASVTPLAPSYGGPNYDQPLWTISYNKAIIPVSFTSYHCTSASLVLEYATWADYTKLDWQTGATNKYTGFIPASASDLSQKVYITIPNLTPSTAYTFRVGAKCTSSSPMGTLAYTTSANQFSTPAAPSSPSITFSGRAIFQTGDAGGSIENNTLLTQKVINLQNTGSNADTFRTTLPVNPETRCGLRGSNDSYPENKLPNTLPITLDTPLGVNETKYIVAVCVTKGLSAGPFTWSYKTVSVGALNVNRTDVNPLIAEVQDTVNITIPIACSDSDGGMNSSIKGVGTGTYAGAVTSYIAIYGQEPNPTTPKSTTEKYSTFIDHCATTTQLNEAYCDADGRLQAIGLPCRNGCSDGVCKAPPPGAAAPEPSNDEPGAWAQVDIATGQVLSSAICTRAVCGINGEYHGYVPPPTFSTGSVWWPTSKRYIWQLSGQAGYGSGSFDFNTFVFTVPGGTIYNGVFTPTPSPPSGTTTQSVNTTTPGVGTTTPPSGTTSPAPSPPPMPTVPMQPFQPGQLLVPDTTILPTPPSSGSSISQTPTTLPQSPPALSALSGAKCTYYLGTVKNTLDSNERYVKKIKQKMKNAPANYVNLDAVSASLTNADSAIGDTRNLIKKTECSQQTLESIRDKQTDIRNALQELAGYNKDELRYFRAYAQCKSTLANRTKRIKALIKKEKNKETKSALQDAVSEIAQKSQEFARDASSADFPEVINQCRDYIKALDGDINFYLRTGKF